MDQTLPPLVPDLDVPGFAGLLLERGGRDNRGPGQRGLQRDALLVRDGDVGQLDELEEGKEPTRTGNGRLDGLLHELGVNARDLSHLGCLCVSAGSMLARSVLVSKVEEGETQWSERPGCGRKPVTRDERGGALVVEVPKRIPLPLRAPDPHVEDAACVDEVTVCVKLGTGLFEQALQLGLDQRLLNLVLCRGGQTLNRVAEEGVGTILVLHGGAEEETEGACTLLGHPIPVVHRCDSTQKEMDVVEGKESSGGGGVGVGGRDAKYTLDGGNGMNTEVDALALGSDGLVVGVGGEQRVEGRNLGVGGVGVVGKGNGCQRERAGREGDSLVGSAQAG